MKKILMIGPFPKGNEGLNGQTIANQTLYDGLSVIYEVKKINTLSDLKFEDKENQGKFKLIKFLKIIFLFFKEIFCLLFNNYDIIYMTPGQSFLGFMRFSPYMLCFFIKKTSCYIHIHGGNFRKMYNKQSNIKKKILSFFIKKMTGVIVLGESLKSMFEGLIENSKIFVCENGVQDKIVATYEEINKKVERVYKNNKRKILYLSNLMKEKGILELLKASEELSEEEFEFNLAGAIEPSLQSIVGDYLERYPNKIIYHGVVSGEKKKQLFLENDIFVLPSWDEGQPISILEAYANGCYVITDELIGGIQDIFKSGINGKSCIAKNEVNLKEVLKNSKNLEEILIENYNKALEKYMAINFIERILNIINLGSKNEN